MTKIKKGLKFKVSGMPDIYEISKIDNNNICYVKWKTKEYTISKSDIELAIANGSYIPEPDKIAKSISNGMTCKKCNNYSQYAQSNQDDGTFICYSCRSI